MSFLIVAGAAAVVVTIFALIQNRRRTLVESTPTDSQPLPPLVTIQRVPTSGTTILLGAAVVILIAIIVVLIVDADTSPLIIRRSSRDMFYMKDSVPPVRMILESYLESKTYALGALYFAVMIAGMFAEYMFGLKDISEFNWMEMVKPLWVGIIVFGVLHPTKVRKWSP